MTNRWHDVSYTILWHLLFRCLSSLCLFAWQTPPQVSPIGKLADCAIILADCAAHCADPMSALCRSYECIVPILWGHCADPSGFPIWAGSVSLPAGVSNCSQNRWAGLWWSRGRVRCDILHFLWIVQTLCDILQFTALYNQERGSWNQWDKWWSELSSGFPHLWHLRYVEQTHTWSFVLFVKVVMVLVMFMMNFCDVFDDILWFFDDGDTFWIWPQLPVHCGKSDSLATNTLDNHHDSDTQDDFYDYKAFHDDALDDLGCLVEKHVRDHEGDHCNPHLQLLPKKRHECRKLPHDICLAMILITCMVYTNVLQ